MSNFLKATVVQDTVAKALARMLVLAPTVWTDPVGSFRGAAGDTVTVRIPAYTEADERAIRAGGSRPRRGLFESKVDIVLDRDLLRDVPLTDPNQTLDLENFTTQVLNPILESIARGIENVLARDAIAGATYDLQEDFDPDNPLASVLAARKALNKANVPAEFRTLAVGADIAEAILASDLLTGADSSGTDQALREGVIGRLRGFRVVESNAIAPDKAYAYHRTAYALATQPPIVPNSANAGFIASEGGFSIRLMEALDSDTFYNIVSGETFIGATEVTDIGTLDEDNMFTPTENPDDSSSAVAGDEHFVRAVELTLDESSA